MGLAYGIFGIFVGCSANAIFLEYLVRIDPGCGNLITFSQFVFISILGFIFTSNFGRKKRNIPVKGYAVVVVMFSLTNTLNNIAFDFKISMPLHMIFRSASLMTNMLMGILILRRRYPISKYISVLLITVGVCLCTLESSQTIEDSPTDSSAQPGLFWWCLGIALLILSLLISAVLGVYQETLFAKYGKHPLEALFYTHLMGLPTFTLVSSSIWTHYNVALNSQPLAIPFTSFILPSMIVYLIGNVTTQYLCISSVYHLSAETTSFVLTLVITLRKFFSLILSIIYFNNVFTINHWIGTLLVFTGTLIFTEIPQSTYKYLSKPKKD